MQKFKNSKINLRSNRNRFILQGFFLVAATTTAETSTVLPLIIDFFGGGKILVGILAALMKGGAILMQLWTAFKAQEYSTVIKNMRNVFIFRFLAWFSIGIYLFFFSASGNILTLWVISILLFLFSFSAGYGIVYYQELMGKSFTKEYRGKAIAYRQIASGLAGILSGGLSGYILDKFAAPISFSYIFLISGLIMAVGFGIFWFFKEPKKEKVSVKEKSFGLFLKNSSLLLKTDKNLRFQIISRLISYSIFFVLPFIILDAKEKFGIDGKDIGFIISLQMAGAMFSNILWSKLASMNRNKYIILISFVMAIIAISMSLSAPNIYIYYIIYFMIGGAIDGLRLAFSNLLLIIAPEEKRVVYIAVQNNITSLGVFFSIPGGYLYKVFNFQVLAIIAIIMLILGFIYSFRLKKA